MKRQHFNGHVVALLLLTAVGLALPGAVRAQITNLGTLGGASATQSTPYAVNGKGYVVGSSVTTTGAVHAFLWSPTTPNGTAGSMKDLGTLGGGTSVAYGVNASGQVVGYSYTTNNAAVHAFLYSGGQMTDLGTLGGTDSVAYAINDSGQIVGQAQNASDDIHACSWASGAMAATDLGTLATGVYSAYSAAFSVNSAGQIAGESDTPNGNTHAFVCSSVGATPKDLGTSTGGSNSSARSINNNGEVVGQSDNSSGNTYGFFWISSAPSRVNGTMYAIGGYFDQTYSDSAAAAINNIGLTIGSLYTSGSAAGLFYGSSTQGYGSSNGGASGYDLSYLLPANSGWTLQAATGVNDAGQVVGYGTMSGKRQAFLLQYPLYDGSNPFCALLHASDGNFYGTTAAGGANGGGTVFKMTSDASHTVTVLHYFNFIDGSPDAGLIQGTDGNLYGTTLSGVIFKITLSGTYTILSDKYGGRGGLIQGSDGNFYGAGAGTVYKVAANGTVTVLHTFTGSDGTDPGALVQGSDGLLYGTTSQGGANSEGTVFKTTTGGVFTSLHSFNGSDGIFPEGGLVQVGGIFYGTTSQGGSGNGNGTVFSITSSGSYLLLASNGAGYLGDLPYATLTPGIGSFSGYLYGTTVNGQNLFRVTTSGVIDSSFGYTFEATPTDGFFPYGPLLQFGNTLYGTTEDGGAYTDSSANPPYYGAGTVYTIDTSGNEQVIHSFTG